MLTDKLVSNPELIPINKTIAEALDALIERKWGTVQFIFSCQNGRIKTMKVIDEKIETFKNDTLT